MNAIVKIILGIILIVIPLILAITFASWGKAVIELLKGAVIILVIAAGIVLLIIGISELSS
ncbi:MAG: hypothetical protein QXL88_02135 [Candidatus Pacearchaeota archaeon]